MSLRRDIHNAFEVIAPPLGGMPERVVQTVLADKRRRRKSAMLFRLHTPLSLVAALIAIALVAAVLVGGRVLQTWDQFHGGSPAGHSQLTPLQQLEARPIHIPSYRSLSDCKASPVANPYGWGSPIAGYGGLAYSTHWGSYFNNIFYTDTPISGPILVRARDLFKPLQYVFVGQFTAGQRVGTDTLAGQPMAQRTEIVLYESQVSTTFTSDLLVPAGKRFVWEFITGVPESWSGYSAWQIDAAGLSEVLTPC